MSVFLTLIFSIGGTHKHSRLLLTSPSSVLLECNRWYTLSIARRGKLHRPVVWGDICGIHCDWARVSCLSCFSSILLVNSQCVLYSDLQIKYQVHRGKIRTEFTFHSFCLSPLFSHCGMSKYICCILIYIKLSCRNVHYTFIVSKTHWNRGVKHLANIRLCGPNGIFRFLVYKNSSENKRSLASDLGENLSNTSRYNWSSGLWLRKWIA